MLRLFLGCSIILAAFIGSAANADIITIEEIRSTLKYGACPANPSTVKPLTYQGCPFQCHHTDEACIKGRVKCQDDVDAKNQEIYAYNDFIRKCRSNHPHRSDTSFNDRFAIDTDSTTKPSSPEYKERPGQPQLPTLDARECTSQIAEYKSKFLYHCWSSSDQQAACLKEANLQEENLSNVCNRILRANSAPSAPPPSAKANADTEGEQFRRGLQAAHAKCATMRLVGGTVNTKFSISNGVVEFDSVNYGNSGRSVNRFALNDIEVIQNRSMTMNGSFPSLHFQFRCRVGSKCIRIDGEPGTVAELKAQPGACSADDVRAYFRLLKSDKFVDQFPAARAHDF